MNKIHSILDYWFADVATDITALPERSALWWQKNADNDAYITEHFSKDVELALAGELDFWAQTATGRLALIILCDQFTRTIYRGAGKAFAGDAKALQLAIEGIEKQHDQELDVFQKVFFYLPFEHSEDSQMQERSVALYLELKNSAPESLQEAVDGFYQYALAHKKIIDQFGRYPHRNEQLGRDSTAQELEFLKQPGSSF